MVYLLRILRFSAISADGLRMFFARCSLRNILCTALYVQWSDI